MNNAVNNRKQAISTLMFKMSSTIKASFFWMMYCNEKHDLGTMNLFLLTSNYDDVAMIEEIAKKASRQNILFAQILEKYDGVMIGFPNSIQSESTWIKHCVEQKQIKWIAENSYILSASDNLFKEFYELCQYGENVLYPLVMKTLKG